MIEEGHAGSKVKGFYLGKVMMHLNHGMLKVFVPGVYPDEMKDHPEMLPNCLQIVSQFGGSHSGNGVFTYPNIGSTVVCCFANDDQNIPLCIGAILGGENAFGQYDIIKNQNEEVSDRHLITAGKSQIEIFENGKISAVVEDPIRTDAAVDYHDQKNILSSLSADCISARPLYDQIEKNQLSNVHCRLLLDNQLDGGCIQNNTHHFLNTSINDDTQTKIEKLTYDNDIEINNNGCNIQTILSNLTLTKNDKQLNVKSNISLNSKIESNMLLFNGFQNHSDFKLTDVKNSNGQTVEQVTDNHLTADFVTSDEMKSNIHIIASKKMNGKQVYDSECYDVMDSINSKSDRKILNNFQGEKCLNQVVMDSKSGVFEITIKDLDSGKSCVYTLDKHGNATLQTSTTVTIISPNIEITGTTHVTGTLTVTKNITGEMDVIASNCTLNKHVHIVPAHCPAIGRTLTGI